VDALVCWREKEPREGASSVSKYLQMGVREREGGMDECANKEGRIITERLRQAIKADARRQHAAGGMNSLRSTVEATEGRATEDGENGGENAFHFGIG